jgi:dephospho-CoA kinase
MIIGLTGTNGSGKDTIAEYLMKKGFKFYSCSDILRDELKKNGIEPTREVLIFLGNKMRKESGASVLADIIKDKIKKSKDKNAVVVSIRNVSEALSLKKLPSFKLIFVDAPITLRYQRVVARGTERDKDSFEEFKNKENKELKGRRANVQQLELCKKESDSVMINDKGLDELYAQVEAVLNG